MTNTWFTTSTTPFTLGRNSVIFSASAFPFSSDSSKTRTSIGCGDQVRSPTRSSTTCGNSTSITGSALLILSRSSSVISSSARERFVLSFTRKSPVLGSAIASASRAPSRNE